ncbi:MAG: CYTH domain-containing protein, partial [Thermoguttaceae bacterium]|nr:CYTH domain-containing protein [Thermoguttaceae bacterium]
MLEIEMKFRVPDADAYERRLRDDFSLVFDAPRSEIDLFFRNEAAGFPTEGKALRIRRQDRRLVATFKGPRLDPKAKIREEIELPLGP